MRHRNRVRGGVVVSMLACGLLLPALAEAQKMVLVVRHAERADDGSMPGEMLNQTDPELSTAGKARAARLAEMLADSGVTAVYATEYKRTQNTGAPTATKLGLTVQTMGARDTNALVAKLGADHADDIVLVIGHSNTVPGVIQALGGPTFSLGEDAYGDLYVFVPATGALTRIKF